MDAEENKSEVLSVDVREVTDAEGHTKRVTTTTKRVTTSREAGDAAPAASEPSASPAPVSGPLGGYEAWVRGHSSLARNLETMFFILPQLVPVRGPATIEGRREG